MSNASVRREDIADRRIVIEGSYLLKPAFGIHKVVVGLIDWLVDLGADVTVLLNRPLPDSVKRREAVNYVVLPTFRLGKGLSYEQISIPRFLKGSSAEVYCAPSNRGIPLRKVPQRTVLGIYDQIPFQGRTDKSVLGHLGLAPNRWSIKTSMWRASRIFTVSKSAQADLLQEQHRHSTLAFLPLSYLGMVPLAPLAPEPYFVFTGGLAPRKNLGPTLQAFESFRKTHPGYELRITGTNDFAKFLEHFELAQLPPGVVLTGRLSNEVLLDLVRRCTAVLYPSQYEGKGLPIIEALATSRPVVCGTGGSQVEVAGSAGIFVDPITTSTLFEAMTSAIAVDPARHQQVARTQFELLDAPMWEQGLLSVLFG
jgi:glycosyltransferase involved in cell wall biosynthesis